jgi:hypothetical protein
MSRFDRRMGTGPYAKTNTPSVKRRFTPRLNETNRKLPSRDDFLLNSDMNNNSDMNDNSITNVINNVAEKNDKILKKLELTNNSSERILLNHELRLNTVELTVDCLNNMNYEKETTSDNPELKEKIITLEQTVTELSNKLILLTQMIEEHKKPEKNKKGIVMNINDIVEKTVEKQVKNNKTISEKEQEGQTFE